MQWQCQSAFSKLHTIQTDGENGIAIPCFMIRKEYPGKGIGQKILDKISEDAKINHQKIIEAYSRWNAKTEFGNFHEPYSMHEKNGFELENMREVEVVRPYLSV